MALTVIVLDISVSKSIVGEINEAQVSHQQTENYRKLRMRWSGQVLTTIPLLDCLSMDPFIFYEHKLISMVQLTSKEREEIDN